MTTSQNTIAKNRAETIQSLTKDILDLLVIGGGIVGAGIARDSAMRGLRVGLVEQHDFAFGTSSRSSRLLHGGLRYLAQGQVRLVREASLEKRILHRIAPHLAEPLPFIFPTYQGTQWPLWQLRIGVKLYDLLCNGKNLGKSSSFSRKELLAQVPNLNPSGLTGGVRYFDGLTNDARLVIDTLRSAAKQGALVVNYFQFKTAARDSREWVCELRDGQSNQTQRLRARAIINATGPWSEQIPHSQVKLRLTKGIHVVFESTRLPVTEAIALAQGRRLLFVIPWGERVIVGTTDTDYRGPLDDVHPELEEIDYLLRAVNELLPALNLIRADIVSTWAGLRPLIVEPGEQTGGTVEAPSDVPRSHQIRNAEPGWWDLAGGKLTTYRLMAEQAIDQVVKWLNKTGQLNNSSGLCRTAEEMILPPSETKGLSGIFPPKFEREIITHFCSTEWAMHLDDLMIRRTGWRYYYRDAQARAEQVSEWMADLLGWTQEKRAAELTRYKQSAPKLPVSA